jgi:hypothetical protein
VGLLITNEAAASPPKLTADTAFGRLPDVAEVEKAAKSAKVKKNK